MDRDGLHELMKSVDMRGVKNEGDWVMAACPFSPYVEEHNYRLERNVSFGISVHKDKLSVYNCFTCHRRGTLTHLLENLQALDGNDYNQMIDELSVSEELGPPLSGWREEGKRLKRKEKVEPLHWHYEDLYDPCPENHPYLRTRGVSADTCKRLQLKIDPDNRGVERIMFPVWGVGGDFYGYTGRATDNEAVPKVRDYHGLPKRHMLLGIHLHKQADYICLAEGPVDYARGQSMGFPTVATMFSSVTEYQLDTLKKLGKTVYGFLDNDAAGKKGCREIAEQLIGHVPFMAVKWPTTVRKRPGATEPCAPGDVGQLFKVEMQRMIDRAQLYRV